MSRKLKYAILGSCLAILLLIVGVGAFYASLLVPGDYEERRAEILNNSTTSGERILPPANEAVPPANDTSEPSSSEVWRPWNESTMFGGVLGPFIFPKGAYSEFAEGPLDPDRLARMATYEYPDRVLEVLQFKESIKTVRTKSKGSTIPWAEFQHRVHELPQAVLIKLANSFLWASAAAFLSESDEGFDFLLQAQMICRIIEESGEVEYVSYWEAFFQQLMVVYTELDQESASILMGQLLDSRLTQERFEELRNKALMSRAERLIRISENLETSGNTLSFFMNGSLDRLLRSVMDPILDRSVKDYALALIDHSPSSEEVLYAENKMVNLFKRANIRANPTTSIKNNRLFHLGTSSYWVPNISNLNMEMIPNGYLDNCIVLLAARLYELDRGTLPDSLDDLRDGYLHQEFALPDNGQVLFSIADDGGLVMVRSFSILKLNMADAEGANSDQNPPMYMIVAGFGNDRSFFEQWPESSESGAFVLYRRKTDYAESPKELWDASSTSE